MKAVLFDIDGTLLNSHGLGGIAFAQALKETTGKDEDMSKVDWLGRTDTDIISAILENNGFGQNEIAGILPEFFKRFNAMFKIYSEQFNKKIEILPYVKEILKALNDVPIGLLTGNVKEAAYVKLRSAGIDKFFPYGIGGFGDEARDRCMLLPIAVKRMNEYYSTDNFEEIIVVGDSHRDIDCARKNSVKSLAVATGKLNLEELQGYKPDFAFNSFENIDEILKILR